MLALLAAAAVTYSLAPQIGSQLADYMKDVFRVDQATKLDFGSNNVLHDTLMKTLRILIAVGLPISCAGFILGVLGSFVQIGIIFSFDPLTPDFSKVDPIKGLQRMFAMAHITDGIRMVFKMCIAAFVAYGLVKSEILGSPAQALNDPANQLGALGRAGKSVFLGLFSIFALFAAIDFIMQRREWGKQTRLTKQEAKQEFKEREGDPAIKARIRAVQRDMARKRMMAAVKKADVIITNPTHIAIAIMYDKEKMNAPRVVAKGADFIAQRIKQIALEAGVPLVENVPLARTLFKTVKLNQSVPRVLYQAVAEVLAFVYRLKNRTQI